MKNNILRIAFVLLLSLVFGGLMAQNVPINLNAGWNWISYSKASVMSLEKALGGLNPAEGDVIKGMEGASVYQNGSWQGSILTLIPGQGYMYYCADGTTKSFVFGGTEADASAIPEAALDGEFTVVDGQPAAIPMGRYAVSRGVRVPAIMTIFLTAANLIICMTRQARPTGAAIPLATVVTIRSSGARLHSLNGPTC